MKSLRFAHSYELDNFEKGGEKQVIQFIEKAPEYHPNGELTGEMSTIYNGTTNEEVMEMLLDRLNKLNDKFPCRENSLAITNLEQSLMWLERRTVNRKARGVEGKHLK